MDFKTVIDDKGNIVELCVMIINDKPQFFTMEENMLCVDFYKYDFVKPKWDGSKWIETATEEELKENEEQNQKGNVELQLSVEEQIKVLKKENAQLQDCILELADMIGNK